MQFITFLTLPLSYPYPTLTLLLHSTFIRCNLYPYPTFAQPLAYPTLYPYITLTQYPRMMMNLVVHSLAVVTVKISVLTTTENDATKHMHVAHATFHSKIDYNLLK